MHRVRHSLPYYKELGWEPIIVTVAPEFIEGNIDPLLLKSIPSDSRIIYIQALSFKWTRRIGLGSLALRSIIHYWFAIVKIVKKEKIDLIFFSTTQFPVLILGNFLKKRYNIPYLIDMQDPWHSDYYKKKPKKDRPPKYWFSYYLNKILEPIAMKRVDAIMSVSNAYNVTLKSRYPHLKQDMLFEVTFGTSEVDMLIAKNETPKTEIVKIDKNNINIIYTGIVNESMRVPLELLLKAVNYGLIHNPNTFTRSKFYFIGTNYALSPDSNTIVNELAIKYKLTDLVLEHPLRISYFQSLKLMSEADILLLFGTDDSNYSASKLYPYILSEKPILSIVKNGSPIIKIMESTGAGAFTIFEDKKSINDIELSIKIYEIILKWMNNVPNPCHVRWDQFEPYLAKNKTKTQVEIFNLVTKNIVNA